MRPRAFFISAGAALGFTFMVSSVSSLVRMAWTTRLDGHLISLWKVYRGFLFETFLGVGFFFIFVPAFAACVYAISRWGIEGRPKL